MMEIQNPNCDGAYCRYATGEVRRVPTGHGSAILCRECFNEEMMWRADRNEDIAKTHPIHEKLPMLRWEELESVDR